MQTMLINSFMPYVTLCSAFAVPWLKRKMDRKFTNDPYITKKTSMFLYKDLYSGNEYVIHFKYSGILNIMYITMMYGLGMPILFPIAVLNFINQYICERIIVVYEVRQPPSLDDKLTKNCISMLKWSPLLFLFNGYWMLSNHQIFLNTWSYIDDSTKHMASSHVFMVDVNWTTPILFMGAVSLFILTLQKLFQASLQIWGYAMQAKDIKVDEDLPNFFESVKLSQADEIIIEDDNMKNNYGFVYNDGDTIATLNASKMPKKVIVGTPWYFILSNAKYSNLFNYIGAFIQEREKLIEDGPRDPEMDEELYAKHKFEQSDMVMVLLNLSFIPDSVVRKMAKHNFEPGWSEKFKEYMDEYKAEFEGEWKYQDQELEQKYLEFVKK